MHKITESDLAVLRDRVWKYVTKTDTCWLWVGAKDGGRYGIIRVAGKNIKAHRATYEILLGKIPDGLTVDHLCRNRECVNPDHMELVTNKENILRGTAPSAMFAKRSTCNHGHPFSLENTGRRKNPSGRVCRECHRLECAKYRKKSHKALERMGEKQ